MHPVLNAYLIDALSADRRREAERFRSTHSEEAEVRSAHMRGGTDAGDARGRGARRWLRAVLATTRS
jgi:hypothetical protein